MLNRHGSSGGEGAALELARDLGRERGSLLDTERAPVLSIERERAEELQIRVGADGESHAFDVRGGQRPRFLGILERRAPARSRPSLTKNIRRRAGFAPRLGKLVIASSRARISAVSPRASIESRRSREAGARMSKGGDSWLWKNAPRTEAAFGARAASTRAASFAAANFAPAIEPDASIRIRISSVGSPGSPASSGRGVGERGPFDSAEREGAPRPR